MKPVFKSSQHSMKSNESDSFGDTTRKEENEPKQQTSNLTDSDYDDIFSSVLQKASSGLLPGVKVKERDDKRKEKSSADNFNKKMNVARFTAVQDANELTPFTSPNEIRQANTNLLKPPQKKKSIGKEKKSESSKQMSFDSVTSNIRDSINGTGKESDNFYKSAEETVPTKEKKKKKKTQHVYDYTEETPKVIFSSSEKVSKKTKKSRKAEEKEIVIDTKLNQGVWVQCDKKSCLKWRFLQRVFDPQDIPEYWTCSMNRDDPEQNNCEAPEVDWMACVEDEDDAFIFTDYNAGSIVWAKMVGYPYWPAMIDNDPDLEVFYDHLSTGVVLRYHVVFLDNNVSRAWIKATNIHPFNKDPNKFEDFSKVPFAGELKCAIEEANKALKMSVVERIQKFNFGTRYTTGEKIGKCWTNHIKRGGHTHTRTKTEGKSSQKSNKEGSSSQKKKSKEAQVVPDIDISNSTPPDNSDDLPFQPDVEADHDSEETQVVVTSPKPKKKKRDKEIEKEPKVKKVKKDKTSEKSKKRKSDEPPANKIKPAFKPAFIAPKSSVEDATKVDKSATVPKSTSEELFDEMIGTSGADLVGDSVKTKKVHAADLTVKTEPEPSPIKKIKKKKSLGVVQPLHPVASSSSLVKKKKPKFKAAFITPSQTTTQKKEKTVECSIIRSPDSSQRQEETLTKINTKSDDDDELKFNYPFEIKDEPIIRELDDDLELEDQNMVVLDGDLPEISGF